MIKNLNGRPSVIMNKKFEIELIKAYEKIKEEKINSFVFFKNGAIFELVKKGTKEEKEKRKKKLIPIELYSKDEGKIIETKIPGHQVFATIIPKNKKTTS